MDTNYEMSYYNYGITLSAEGIVPSFKQQEGGKDSHEYVDLGLPSGILWATTNIQDADGNDLYFAWGETQGYTASQVGTDKNFAWNDYEFGIENNLSKYNESDEKTVLESTDDVATVNWGSGWRMPTEEEMNELCTNTTRTLASVGGVFGMKFVSNANGNELFFPGLGVAENGRKRDTWEGCFYWSASLNSNDNNYAIGIYFDPDGGGYTNNKRRSTGCPVRPVRAN